MASKEKELALSRAQQERVQSLLIDTVTLLCKNSITFQDELKVEGLLGITVDKEVFLVNINEKFTEEKDSDTEEATPQKTSNRREKRSHDASQSPVSTNRDRPDGITVKQEALQDDDDDEDLVIVKDEGVRERRVPPLHGASDDVDYNQFESAFPPYNQRNSGEPPAKQRRSMSKPAAAGSYQSGDSNDGMMMPDMDDSGGDDMSWQPQPGTSQAAANMMVKKGGGYWTGGVVWRCAECGKEYTGKAHLMRHMRLKHQKAEVWFTCQMEDCLVKFTDLGKLTKHQQEQHQKGPGHVKEEEQLRDEISESDIKTTENIDKPNDTLNEDISPKYAHKDKDIVPFIIIGEESNIYETKERNMERNCPVCDEIFYEAAKLQNHVREKYKGDIRYACAVKECAGFDEDRGDSGYYVNRADVFKHQRRMHNIDENEIGPYRMVVRIKECPTPELVEAMGDKIGVSVISINPVPIKTIKTPKVVEEPVGPRLLEQQRRIGKGRIACGICRKEFKLISQLRSHCKEIHTEAKVVFCCAVRLKCKRYYKNVKDLNRHQRNSHNEVGKYAVALEVASQGIVQCEIIPDELENSVLEEPYTRIPEKKELNEGPKEKESNKGPVTRKQSKEKVESNYNCPVCEETFEVLLDFTNHCESMHKKDNIHFACIEKECCFTAGNKLDLDEHQWNKHGKYNGNYCIIARRADSLATADETGDKNAKNETVDKMPDIDVKDSPPSSPVATNNKTRSKSRESRKRSSTEEIKSNKQRFAVGNKFLRKRRPRDPSEVHYLCPVCKAGFPTLETFHHHQLKGHPGLRVVFGCGEPLCNVERVKRNDLLRHMRQAHGYTYHKPGPVQIRTAGLKPKARNTKSRESLCYKCGCAFSNRFYLMEHQRAVHQKTDIVCVVQGCDKRYKFKNSLTRHYRHAHPEIMSTPSYLRRGIQVEADPSTAKQSPGTEAKTVEQFYTEITPSHIASIHGSEKQVEQAYIVVEYSTSQPTTSEEASGSGTQVQDVVVYSQPGAESQLKMPHVFAQPVAAHQTVEGDTGVELALVQESSEVASEYVPVSITTTTIPQRSSDKQTLSLLEGDQVISIEYVDESIEVASTETVLTGDSLSETKNWGHQ